MSEIYARTRQGGSVAAFVIVGIILAVLVIGGVYTVRKGGQGSSPSPSVATSPSTAPSNSPHTTPSKSPSPSPAQKAPSTGTAPLPTTGPEDNVISTVMIAVLVGVATAYVQSRRTHLYPQSVSNR